VKDLRLEQLRKQIEADLEPVPSLSPPWKRALSLLVFWCLSVCFVLLVFGIRSDYVAVGPQAVWGLSLLQWFMAYAIVTVGIRLTIPGSDLSSALIWLTVLAGVLIHLGVSETTFRLSPISVEPDRVWQMALICYGITLVLGLLPLSLLLLSSSRGLPVRPLTTGLLCGLGSGLSGEAVWRIHCSYTTWDHVLFAHTGAVLTAGILGILFGFWWQRRRRTAA
jgi:hypothetical protein